MITIKKTLLIATAIAFGWLATPQTAHATLAYTSPFSSSAGTQAYITTHTNGITYILWFDKANNNCSAMQVTGIANVGGLYDNVIIYGKNYNDELVEWPLPGYSVCNYGLNPVNHNSYWISIQAGGGNDMVVTPSNQTFAYGGTGDDKLCGCSSTASWEYYSGGGGTNDCLHDGNGAYGTAIGIEDFTSGCGCWC